MATPFPRFQIRSLSIIYGPFNVGQEANWLHPVYPFNGAPIKIDLMINHLRRVFEFVRRYKKRGKTKHRD